MTAPAPAPERLTDPAEVLYRQVHPNHAEGELSKAAFLPTKTEALMLSTARGRIGADKAYQRWVATKRATIGSYGISVAEIDGTRLTNAVTKVTVALQAIDDEATEGPDHASVVFTELSKGQREQAARKLRDHALERGCLHP